MSSSAALVDIGANLAHDSFDPDRSEVIRRARDAGVDQIIITGSSLASTRKAIELAAADEALYCTAGVHPHHASELDAGHRASLLELARAPGVVAVGECGLDFFRNYSPRPDQETAFRMQLQIAVETGMPVFLHQREAHDRFLAILDEFAADRPPGVAHCFTGGPEEMDAYLERGLYIGVTGWICDERRGHALRDAVARLPLDRVMIETDAPYLLPRDLDPRPKSRRNEPVYLPHILEAVARGMGESPETVAAASTHNARSLFRLGAPSS
ncbi:MAG: TatD family hydrolase [Gammaproteobacteria bacterium]